MGAYTFPPLFLALFSQEFALIRHRLRMSLGTTPFSALRAWDLTSPHVAKQYRTRTAGCGSGPAGAMLELHSFVDLRELDNANTPEKIHARGLHIGRAGMVFGVGTLALPQRPAHAHQFLLCRVAVGRAFVLEDPSVLATAPAQVSVPHGYDSLHLLR